MNIKSWFRGRSNKTSATPYAGKEDKMRFVSNSETSDLAKCERLWYYRHKLRLAKIGQYSDPLAFGIYGHEWLEGYYKAIMVGASIKEAMDAGHAPIIHRMNAMELEGALAARITTLMARYVNFYHEEDLGKYRILAVERKFTAPIADEYGIAIRLDVLKYGISGHHRGEIIIEDHKFTNNFWSPTVLMNVAQIPKYIWTVNNDPDMKVLLDGRQVNKGYLNQLRYRRMADGNEFFRRSRIEPTITRINNIMREHGKYAEHAADMHTMPNEEVEQFVSRALNKDVCDFCEFLIPCSMSLDGLDEQPTLQIGYKPNEYGYNN